MSGREEATSEGRRREGGKYEREMKYTLAVSDTIARQSW